MPELQHGHATVVHKRQTSLEFAGSNRSLRNATPRIPQEIPMKLISVAALALMAAAPAFANTSLTIDFEAATSFASVGGTYATQGASFSGAALALANDGTGTGVDGAFFTNAHTPGTSNPLAGTVMFVNPVEGSAVMNITAGGSHLFTGFINQVSFDFASTADAFNLVQVYSGLNGTGTRLAKISLSENQIDSGCTSSSFCNWQTVTMSFKGTAQSLVFAANGGNIAYDNVTITAVPEPETYAMMLSGLMAIGFLLRRRQS
jgi:hypothetical protein